MRKLAKVSKKYPTSGFAYRDPELLRRAKARAKSKRWSFSTYVADLIESDLRASGLWPPVHTPAEILAAQAVLNDAPSPASSDAVAPGRKPDTSFLHRQRKPRRNPPSA